MYETTPNPNYYTAEHQQFRQSLREFVAREITPYVEQWDQAESFPRDLYRKASGIAACVGYPEEYGGTPDEAVTERGNTPVPLSCTRQTSV